MHRRTEQQVLYLDVDDSIKMQYLRPSVINVIEQLIVAESKKSSN